MNRSVPSLLAVCGLMLVSHALADSTQAELDAQCEADRQAKLAPERQRYIEECVEKEQRPDRAACERFYADYGNRSGDRAPLYYDLPACQKAFEHRKSGDDL